MISTLLDIRRIIAGLLGEYGVILLVAGIVGSTESKNKAAGVNINLWAGIVLLLMATFFLVWALMRPLSEELDEAAAEARGEAGRPETEPPEEPR
jgi:flagellar biosynthesis/type III secretory pathway M-ring protein FliF/YscJ